jgi:uncharacterized protein (DUF1684 family)
LLSFFQTLNVGILIYHFCLLLLKMINKSRFFAVLFLLLSVGSTNLYGQNIKVYNDSLKKFQQNYVDTHEIVKGADKAYFDFYPVNITYRITADFSRINDTLGFAMFTSSGKSSTYFKYGKLSFRVKDTACVLYLYQSKDLMAVPQYKEYLFIPFTDPTNAITSYGAGRYLDFFINEIKGNKIIIDFNKAYNPYCAYAAGFQCPLPPKESYLPVAIIAGEKNFKKSMH